MKKQKNAVIETRVKDDGSRVGKYTAPSGEMYTYTLNNRRTGHYALTGTMSMVDPVTKGVLKIYNSEKERYVPASQPIHVRMPRAEEDVNRLITKELDRVAQLLRERYMRQYVSAFSDGKMLDEMTFVEVRLAYETEAAVHFSKSPEKQKKYMKALKKVELPDKPLGKLQKREVSAAIEQVSGSLAGQKSLLTKLLNLLEFAEDKKRVKSVVTPIVEQMLNAVTAKLEKDNADKKRVNDAKNASNSDVLSNAAEEALNRRCVENCADPKFVAMALIKGGGLPIEEVCGLKIKQCLREKDPEKLFLKIDRKFASATQNYTFPLFPFEAWLLNVYLDDLESQDKNRLDPEKYLFSEDGGKSAISSEEVRRTCQQALKGLRFGVADLLGSVDLQKEKGVQLLRNTYKCRLERYCGLTREKDEGAWLFMRHLSLGNRVQADHYRGFTGESGRMCLYDYVHQDRRSLPALKQKQKELSFRTTGDRRIHTVNPPDHENEQQMFLKVELRAGEWMWLEADHGCIVEVVELQTLVEEVP